LGRTDCVAWKDVAILDLAESEGCVVLTVDKDFWQIAVQRRIPLKRSGVALFRVHPATPENLEPIVRAFVEANRDWAGHISIVGSDGIQMAGSTKELTPTALHAGR